jgi:precorrin-6B methylase 2
MVKNDSVCFGIDKLMQDISMSTTKISPLVSLSSTDKALFENLPKLLYSDSIFINIGADRGNCIALVNKTISKSSLYAIESDPTKFEQLKANCSAWEKESDNKIHLLNTIIGDREEAADTFKLDTLFKPLKPDLIKIDVSGDALPILQGSQTILKLGKTRFLIKIESEDSKSKICDFMKSFNYYPTDFYGMVLFGNPQKHQKYHFAIAKIKQIGRKIVPPAIRYWIRQLIKR